MATILDEWRPGDLLIAALRVCGVVLLIGGIVLLLIGVLGGSPKPLNQPFNLDLIEQGVGYALAGAALCAGTGRSAAGSGGGEETKRLAITAAPHKKDRRDSHGSQSDSSERDLCNARCRARRLCGDAHLSRLLPGRRSCWNQRVLLRRRWRLGRRRLGGPSQLCRPNLSGGWL
jgi:hypothetical protein